MHFRGAVLLDGGAQLPSGAANGLVATSDASGNISWVAAPEEWTTLQRARSVGITPAAGSTNMLSESGTSNGWLATTGSMMAVPAVYLDPSHYSLTGRALQLRLLVSILRNAVAISNNTITFGLYPVSATAGASGALTGTIGTVVSGTTVPFVNPATSTPAGGATSPLTFNTTNVPVGTYIFGVAVTGGGTPGSGSVVSVDAQLQVRNT